MHRLTCPVCGAPITARRRTRRTCSGRCRTLLSRRRRHAAACQASGLDPSLAHAMAARVHRGRSRGTPPESPGASPAS